MQKFMLFIAAALMSVGLFTPVFAKNSRLGSSNGETEYVVVYASFPTANCPEAIEIIGDFDDLQGTAMEIDNGRWVVELEASADQYFKFRSALSWNQEIERYIAEDDRWVKIANGQLTFGDIWEDGRYHGVDCKMIELDFTNADYYRWSVPTPVISGDVAFLESTQATITCAITSFIEIFYTLDGSNPIISGTLYYLPLTITANTTVKAVAHSVQSDAWSDVAEVTFTKGTPVTLVFSANGNYKEVSVALPHTFSCSYLDEDYELDRIIQELYELEYGGYCEPGDTPAAVGSPNVTAGINGNDQYITISAPFEGSVTVSGGYNKYLDDMGDNEDVMDYNLTIYMLEDEPAEPVVVAILFPTENLPTTVEIATSNDQWVSGAAMEFISSTGYHMNSEIEAYAEDTLIFRDANNHETVLCQYVPGNGGGDGKWEVVKLVFGDEWTDDTWKGEPVKFIELELNEAAQYAWTVAGTTGVKDIEGNNAQIFGSNQRIVINNAEAVNVAIYDMMGREIVKEQRINSNNAVFAMPQRGMYIVRMGNVAKKVFVK